MAVSENGSGLRDASRAMKIGGYTLVVGILIGITLGVYALFNPHFFLTFISISAYEATSFFLGIYLPSLVVIVGVGYMCATRSRLSNLNMRRTAVLCALLVLCLTLASLSIFNFLAVLGGIIALVAVVLAQTQPSFKVLWKREASFFVETGSMLIMSASTFFLVMLAMSRLLQTYSPGVYTVSYSYPYVLLVIAILSFLTFAITPSMGLHGSKAGLCGVLAFAVSVASFAAAIQNQYIYFNPSVYQGIVLLGAGVAMTLTGALVYFKLSLSGELLPKTVSPSFIYKGQHCPHCGASWKDSRQNACPNCGQSLYSEQSTSFCPHCGRLVHQNAKNCPHCGEDVTSLPVHISVVTPREKGLFSRILDSFELSMKELVVILILLAVFNFAAYISYVRPETANFGRTIILHYGIPIEWLHIVLGQNTGVAPGQPGASMVQYNMRAVVVTWVPLVLDLTIYFLLAFSIVYGIVKLRSRKWKVR